MNYPRKRRRAVPLPHRGRLPGLQGRPAQVRADLLLPLPGGQLRGHQAREDYSRALASLLVLAAALSGDLPAMLRDDGVGRAVWPPMPRHVALAVHGLPSEPGALLFMQPRRGRRRWWLTWWVSGMGRYGTVPETPASKPTRRRARISLSRLKTPPTSVAYYLKQGAGFWTTPLCRLWAAELAGVPLPGRASQGGVAVGTEVAYGRADDPGRRPPAPQRTTPRRPAVAGWLPGRALPSARTVGRRRGGRRSSIWPWRPSGRSDITAGIIRPGPSRTGLPWAVCGAVICLAAVSVSPPCWSWSRWRWSAGLPTVTCDPASPNCYGDSSGDPPRSAWITRRPGRWRLSLRRRRRPALCPAGRSWRCR